MTNRSEKEIILLYQEFKSLSVYKQKLKFFDKNFTLLPFNFPSFDPNLSFLLDSEKINSLINILERERKEFFPLSRKLIFDDNEYFFDVTPYNSNRQFLNDYIITKVISTDVRFSEVIENIREETDPNIIKSFKAKATETLEVIKQIIENKKDTTFRSQFLNVFYRGFLDYNDKQLKKYNVARKFIELYLYSLGILFAQYNEALIKHPLSSISPPEKLSPNSYEFDPFRQRILFLNELGFTEFLRDKYKNLEKIEIENKIAETFCVIIGADPKKAKDIIAHLA